MGRRARITCDVEGCIASKLEPDFAAPIDPSTPMIPDDGWMSIHVMDGRGQTREFCPMHALLILKIVDSACVGDVVHLERGD